MIFFDITLAIDFAMMSDSVNHKHDLKVVWKRVT